MSYWYDYLIETERRRDEIAQAAARRRIDRILSENEAANGAGGPPVTQRAPRRYELVLAALGAALGDFLIAWGCRLQSRYSHLLETTSNMGAEPVLARQNADSAGCA